MATALKICLFSAVSTKALFYIQTRWRVCGHGPVQTICGFLACKQRVRNAISVKTLVQQGQRTRGIAKSRENSKQRRSLEWGSRMALDPAFCHGWGPWNAVHLLMLTSSSSAWSQNSTVNILLGCWESCREYLQLVCIDTWTILDYYYVAIIGSDL